MVSLGSAKTDTLTGYQSNIAVQKSNVKKQSIAEDEAARSTDDIVTPEIKTNADAQNEADKHNTASLAAIGVKEAIAATIKSIVGAQIKNLILRTADG